MQIIILLMLILSNAQMCQIICYPDDAHDCEGQSHWVIENANGANNGYDITFSFKATDIGNNGCKHQMTMLSPCTVATIFYEATNQCYNCCAYGANQQYSPHISRRYPYCARRETKIKFLEYKFPPFHSTSCGGFQVFADQSMMFFDEGLTVGYSIEYVGSTSEFELEFEGAETMIWKEDPDDQKQIWFK